MSNKDPINNLSSQVSALQEQVSSLEQQLGSSADTPAARVSKLREGLRRMMAEGSRQPVFYQCPVNWAEVEDLAEELRPIRDLLPDGLFRKTLLWLQEARR